MLRRTCITASLLSITLLLSGHATQASEPEFGSVTLGFDFGLSPPAVHVARDGDAWTEVIPGELTLGIVYEAHMKKGYIVNHDFGRLSGLGNSVALIWPPLGEPNPNQADRSISGAFNEQMNTALFTTGERESMVAACTSQANEANGFEATFNFVMGFEVDAKRRRRWGSGGWHAFGDSGKKVVSAVLPIRIICEPPSHHVTEPPVPFKVTGAELYLATFKGEGPVPTQGTSCKVLKVTARFNTTTSGLVHFDLSRKVGDQPLATIPITIEAKKKQDGTYAAEYVKDWFLDKPANAQFFVQEIDGQGLSAGWKDINITCDNNLADPTSQPPSDEPTLKVLKSTFSVTTFQNDLRRVAW